MMKQRKLKEVGAMLLSLCLMVTIVQSIPGRLLKVAAEDPGTTYVSTEALVHTTVTVPYNTTKEDAIKALDTTVGVTANNSTSTVTGSAIIAWTIDNYVASTPGNYTATGTLTLPDGWTGTPSTVSAIITVSWFDKGKGTSEDPWQIATPKQLDLVRTDLDAYYILTDDIDLTEYLSVGGAGYNGGAGWNPIGEPDKSFSGTFDGAGHIITGLRINRPYEDYVGLFSGTNYSTIKNVGLVDVNITGKNLVGGLVGGNLGDISSSFATGSVQGEGFVGGLIGLGFGIHSNTYDSTIKNTYYIGIVKGLVGPIGGVIGGNEGKIKYSYSSGKIISPNDFGGMVETNNYNIESSYYNLETAECGSISSGGLTTVQMKKQTSFIDWNFTAGTGNWKIIENYTYPILQWQSWTADERITIDQRELALTYGGSDHSSSVTSNLILPTSGANGTTISWSSSDTSIVADNGVVTRPSGGNRDVTLTATVSYSGGINQTKVFILDVIKQPATITSTLPTTLTEALSNDGSLISGEVVINLSDGSFVDNISKSDITASNLPVGMDFTVDRIDATHLSITITGKATSHTNTNDVSALTFTIAKAKVNNAQEDLPRKDLDLRVMFGQDNIPAELLKSLPANHTLIQMSLNHSGEFGFRVRLRLPLTSIRSGKFANLYYYNPVTNLLELQSSIQVTKEGYAEFDFTHASDYVILIDEGDTFHKLVETIIITPSKKILYIGGTQGKTVSIKAECSKLMENCIGEEGLEAVLSYNSSNPKVATVSSTGKVIAKSIGKTIITTTITINGVSKNFQISITVKKAYIKLTKKETKLKTGDEYLFQAVGYGVNTKKITWRTTEKSILLIDETTGKATAKSVGVDYVVAKVGSVRLKVKLTVIK